VGTAGMEHGTTVMWRGMGVPPQGGLGRANGAVSRDERSKESGIFVGCRSVDGVNRGESVHRPVGSVVVLERAWSRAYDFFKIPDVCSIALPCTYVCNNIICHFGAGENGYNLYM
jgi:hypothetical protein